MSNVIKFQAPFERLKIYDSCPDVNLRKAIITQAIIDASNTAPSGQAKKDEIEAKAWIFTDNKDFYQTCMEAGLEVSFVRRLAKEVIKLHKSKTDAKAKRSATTTSKTKDTGNLQAKPLCY